MTYFYPTLHISYFGLDSIKINILKKLHEDWIKTMSSIVCTWLFLKIALMTWFFDPTIPVSNSSLDFITMNILTKFHEDWIKMCPIECTPCFTKIEPSA